MHPQQLAVLLGELVDDYEEAGLDAATPSDDPPMRPQYFSPSIVMNRAYLAIVRGDEQFLITVEKV